MSETKPFTCCAVNLTRTVDCPAWHCIVCGQIYKDMTGTKEGNWRYPIKSHSQQKT